MRQNEVTNYVKKLSYKIIVKTLKQNEKVGTGFAVANNIIITCYHVISDYDTILVGNKESEVVFKDKEKDIAILKVEINNEDSLILDENIEINDECYSYGYPKDFSDGSSLTYEFEGFSKDKNLEFLKLKDGQFQSGFSGSAILNLSTGKICGLISETRDTNTDLGGYGIPIKYVKEILNNKNIIFNENKLKDIKEKKPKSLDDDLATDETVNYKNIVFICNHLYKKYESSDNKVLKDISISLYYGEITLLVGKNGAGKTTLLEIIASKLLPSNKETCLYYPEILIPANTHSLDYLNKKIAYIPQEYNEIRGTVKENLIFTLATYQNIFGKDNIKVIRQIVKYFSLDKYIDKLWTELSTGYKLRALLAITFLKKPKLIILDEPLANLDIGMKSIFLNDLKTILKKLNNEVSIIFTSHDIFEAETIADKLIILENGILKYNGKMKEFKINREKNIYEIKTDCNIETLKLLLREFLIDIIEYENKFVLTTNILVNSNKILSVLSNKGYEISYFRDISKSSSIYLEEK